MINFWNSDVFVWKLLFGEILDLISEYCDLAVNSIKYSDVEDTTISGETVKMMSVGCLSYGKRESFGVTISTTEQGSMTIVVSGFTNFMLEELFEYLSKRSESFTIIVG